MDISFSVNGDPIPQGSKTAFVRGGKAVIVDGKGAGIKKHKDWRAAVKSAAETAQAEETWTTWDGPAEVHLWFYMAKPKSKPIWKVYPDTKPDIDKLIRSILDSITGNLISNDSRVVKVVAEKVFAEPTKQGVFVKVITLDDKTANPHDRLF